jgi:hypothetical protein
MRAVAFDGVLGARQRRDVYPCGGQTVTRPAPRALRSEAGEVLGQQKGSKRSKSSLRNRAEISCRGPQSRINRAIARRSSSTVVTLEPACHAGGRGSSPVAPVKVLQNRRGCVVNSDTRSGPTTQALSQVEPKATKRSLGSRFQADSSRAQTGHEGGVRLRAGSHRAQRAPLTSVSRRRPLYRR